MLIRALRAENFMKFRNLDIDEVPERGLIGLEGSNEGGKSSIGELIQFALFGKTVCTRDSSIIDLIHWEHDHCLVELDFTQSDADGTRPVAYRIWREIDRYGANFARLVRLDDRRELASGAMQVQEQLEELLRFDFADFERSFFLSEKDFPRSPQQMQEFLDRMVGVDILERVENEVRLEVTEREEEFGRLQSEVQRNAQQIEKYVPNIARIPEVERQRDQHAEKLEELKNRDRAQGEEIEALEKTARDREGQRDRLRAIKDRSASKLRGAVDNALRGYPEGTVSPVLDGSRKDLDKVRGRLQRLQGLMSAFDRLLTAVSRTRDELGKRLEGSDESSFPALQGKLETRLETARKRRGRAFAGSVSMLFVAALLAGAAANQQFGEGGPLASLRLTLDGGANLGFFSWIVGGYIISGVFLLLTLLLAVRGSRQGGMHSASQIEVQDLERQRQATREDREGLVKFPHDTVPIDGVVQALGFSRLSEIQGAVSDFEKEHKDVLGEAGGLESFCASLADDEHRVIQRLRSRFKEVKKERQKTTETQRQEQSKRDRAESEVREYQKQDGRRAILEEQNAELEEEAGAIREDLEMRRLLMHLLRETIESTRHRAGPSIGKSLRRMLPHLTGGRYTDLQITPDFRMRLFTSEKSDFLNPNELSGGTFEGLSLGFRLAYSQAFICAITHAPQFLFLDEPFKAMDRTRIHGTLSVLTRLSPELGQIFVVLPGIEPEDRELFDAFIETRVGEGEITSRLGGERIVTGAPVTIAPPPPVAAADEGVRDTARAEVEAASELGPTPERPRPAPAPGSTAGDNGGHVIYPDGLKGRDFQQDPLPAPSHSREEEKEAPPEA